MRFLRALATLMAAAALVSCETPEWTLYTGAVSAQLLVSNDAERRLDPVATLSKDQLKRLKTAIHLQPVPESYAACFVPHHFFRIYDAAGKMLGEIAVCFCCQGIQATPARPVPENMDLGADYQALAALVRELGSTPRRDCAPNEAEGF